MHHAWKAAAVIAALGLLGAAALGAAPREVDTASGATLARGPGGQPGQGMRDGRGGPEADITGRGSSGVPGWQTLPKLDKALTVDTAKERVSSALRDWGYANLAVDTVVEYQSGFYALVKEKTSGKAALEVFVDPTYGTVTAESGPAASWNTAYGRSLSWPLPSGKTISADEAKKLAQQWLDRSRDTTKYDLKVVELPGYYSVQLLNGGKLSGLVAVHATTSQVWFRGWRGGGRLAAGDASDAG